MDLKTLPQISQFKDEYVRLIAKGHNEGRALNLLKVEWLDFFELCAKDPDFRKDIEEARKARAEVWVGKIMEDVEDADNSTEPIPSNEIPGRKLRFEQLKFLAKADNPDRYGEGGGKGSTKIAINLNDFKLLAPQEAIKVLANDPFNKMATIEVESQPVKEGEDE